MDALDHLEATIRARRNADPDGSYVAALFAKGRAKIAQKVGEEAVETVIAAMADPAKLVPEAADLVFHLLVLLNASGASLDDVRAELVRREGLSGHDEKASRTPAPLSLSGVAADDPAAPGLPLKRLD